MSRLVTSLCQPPAFGSFGSPTFIGGPSGASTDNGAAIDVTSLPRATWSPATPLSTRADLKAAWGALKTERVVWFDAYTALYGLSRHADSANFSVSFWYNPYDEEFLSLQGAQPSGALFGNSGGAYVNANGVQDNGSEFRCLYTSNPPSGVVFSMEKPTDNPASVGGTVNCGYAVSGVAGFTTDPIDFMQGWCHIMIGLHNSGSKPTITIYVNDTAILTNHTIPTNIDGFGGASESFATRFSDPTFTDPLLDFGDAPISCPWHVGGQSKGSISSDDDCATLPLKGAGLIGALTEVWIAPGQYVDWTSSANRLKFHQTGFGTYAPVDIGKNGATPTGTKPQYYFTGGPDNFPINRANGKYVAVFHNSSGATLPGGVIGKIQPYDNIPDTA